MQKRIFSLAITASALTLSFLANAQEKTPPPVKAKAEAIPDSF